MKAIGIDPIEVTMMEMNIGMTLFLKRQVNQFYSVREKINEQI